MKTCRKGLHQYDEAKPRCPLCELDYRYSERYKVVKRRYVQSEKGQATIKRYQHSPRKKAYNRLFSKVLGKEWKRSYQRTYRLRKMSEDPEYNIKIYRRINAQWRAQGRRLTHSGWTGLSMKLKKEMGLE